MALRGRPGPPEFVRVRYAISKAKRRKGILQWAKIESPNHELRSSSGLWRLRSRDPHRFFRGREANEKVPARPVRSGRGPVGLRRCFASRHSDHRGRADLHQSASHPRLHGPGGDQLQPRGGPRREMSGAFTPRRLSRCPRCPCTVAPTRRRPTIAHRQRQTMGAASTQRPYPSSRHRYQRALR